MSRIVSIVEGVVIERLAELDILIVAAVEVVVDLAVIKIHSYINTLIIITSF